MTGSPGFLELEGQRAINMVERSEGVKITLDRQSGERRIGGEQSDCRSQAAADPQEWRVARAAPVAMAPA